jgi:hypothetical protein
MKWDEPFIMTAARGLALPGAPLDDNRPHAHCAA